MLFVSMEPEQIISKKITIMLCPNHYFGQRSGIRIISEQNSGIKTNTKNHLSLSPVTNTTVTLSPL